MTAAEYALDLCARMAAQTDVPGTITRTFLSAATRAVHAMLRAEMEALGMTVRTDNAGNVRGLYAPSPSPASSATQPLSSFAAGGGSAFASAAPVLLLGSHIDTVPNAGAYDGPLGVAAALALVRSLRGHRLPFAMEVIAFSEEEGVRFKLPFVGSRALVGALDAEALARTDSDGVSVAQAIRDFGLDPAGLDNARMTPNTFAYLEVHIEQGPVLESLDLPLGVVTGIIGQTRLGVMFTGEANHAGTTPMRFRRDALVAAARWIGEVAALPLRDPELLATVGSVEALPGASNVVPGKVQLSLDVRHPSDAARAEAVNALRQLAHTCARDSRCSVSFTERSSQASIAMDAALVEALAEAVGPEAYRMHSGAGHDAMILAPHVPSAMLFVRTPRGLSHHPEESVATADVEAALAACLGFVETLRP